MQPPPSPSRPLQIDPALGYHPQGYYSYPQGSASSLVPNHSSPSGSESVGTPPDGFTMGKRSASQLDSGSRKKPRTDGDSEFSVEREGSEPKAKSTRGSRYVHCPSHLCVISLDYQSMHRLPSIENEMCGGRTRPSL